MRRRDHVSRPDGSLREGALRGTEKSGSMDRMASFPSKVEGHWSEQGWTRHGDRVVVACSGGLDSLTLLHLVRFSADTLGLRVEAAYFDHRMREGTLEDVAWLRGVTGAWNIPLHVGVAPEIPSDEGRARAFRYEYLGRLLEERDARWILTAHHADDQIETVLFRILRGTGLDGLRGMPAAREPGVLRPLLPFFREELESYARSVGLRPRIDPTNRSTRFARNRVRHKLLPLMEEVHPGARRAILRLARNASRSAGALSELMRNPLHEVVLESSADRVVLDRGALLRQSDVIRIEILRWAAQTLSAVPSESGTAAALEFITRGSSGAGVRLSGALTLSREFSRIVVTRDALGEGTSLASGEAELVIPSPTYAPAPALGETTPPYAEGWLTIGDRRYGVCWGLGTPSTYLGQRGSLGVPWKWGRFDLSELRFPLRVRSWRDGDMTRTTGGKKKLKKLFLELRLPRGERHEVPLLVDSDGLVLWIPGWHRVPTDPHAVKGEGRRAWFVGVGRPGGHGS